MNTTTSTQPIIATPDESILVVKRSLLFASHEPFHGLATDMIEDFMKIITAHQEFLPRSLMEQDPAYKQVIPYLIFKHANHYFLMQRRSTASEQRLKNKLTLGIGGHMRQEDMLNGSTIFDWAKREFHEEVNYQGSLKMTPLGLINDDSNPVGQVHIGLALLIEGDSDAISVRSELKEGAMVSLEECFNQYDRLESWSQIICDHLMAHTAINAV